MKDRIATAVLCLLLATVASGAGHFSKTIADIDVAHIECFLFRLDGVREADPAVPRSPWFAIRKSRSGAQEYLSRLLNARITNAPLQRIETTGTAVCGHAEVAHIDF